MKKPYILLQLQKKLDSKFGKNVIKAAYILLLFGFLSACEPDVEIAPRAPNTGNRTTPTSPAKDSAPANNNQAPPAEPVEPAPPRTAVITITSTGQTETSEDAEAPDETDVVEDDFRIEQAFFAQKVVTNTGTTAAPILEVGFVRLDSTNAHTATINGVANTAVRRGYNLATGAYNASNYQNFSTEYDGILGRDIFVLVKCTSDLQGQEIKCVLEHGTRTNNNNTPNNANDDFEESTTFMTKEETVNDPAPLTSSTIAVVPDTAGSVPFIQHICNSSGTWSKKDLAVGTPAPVPNSMGPHEVIPQYMTATVGNTDVLRNEAGVQDYTTTSLNTLRNYAIFKISMRPGTRAVFNEWAQRIGQNKTCLELTVEPKKISTLNSGNGIYYGEETDPINGAGRFLNDDANGRFRLVNRNVYEIYHGNNMFNSLGNHAVNNIQVQRRLGKILNNNTTTITYFYHDNNDNEKLIDELIRNQHGLVQFPVSGEGFGRYGTVDAGGTDNVVRPNVAQEVVGQGDHYLMPLTAAALYAIMQDVNSRSWNVDLGDMSSENGSDPWQVAWVTAKNRNTSRGHHSGHGHMGSRSGLDVDLRYLDANGNSFHGTIADASFNDANNITLFQIAFDNGFHNNYATTKHHYAGVNGNVGEHRDHGHWGLGNINAENII